MADLVTLQAQRDALLEARSNGVLTVEYEGRRVTYKADAELAAALANVEQRIAALDGRRITEIRVKSAKGLA